MGNHKDSLRSRRLEVAGERENGRARGRHARVAWNNCSKLFHFFVYLFILFSYQYLFNLSILTFSLPSPLSSFEVFILGDGDGVEKAQCALTI